MKRCHPFTGSAEVALLARLQLDSTLAMLPPIKTLSKLTREPDNHSRKFSGTKVGLWKADAIFLLLRARPVLVGKGCGHKNEVMIQSNYFVAFTSRAYM